MQLDIFLNDLNADPRKKKVGTYTNPGSFVAWIQLTGRRLDRLEQLAILIGASSPATAIKIGRLNDYTGMLYVVWAEKPSSFDTGLVSGLWKSVFGEYYVDHYIPKLVSTPSFSRCVEPCVSPLEFLDADNSGGVRK